MKNTRETFEKLVNLYNKKEDSILIKILNNRTGIKFNSDYLILNSQDSEFSQNRDIDIKLKELVKNNLSKKSSKLLFLDENLEECLEKDSKISIFYELLQKKVNLFIFGGGHCSMFIARLASLCHLKTYVIEDREEFIKQENFPEDSVLIKADTENLESELEKRNIDISDLNSYFVIVTRGHKFDKAYLEKLLYVDTDYIGMIGSKRKVLKTIESLKEIHKDVNWEKIHSPIGLDIGAQTPEEISVSIVAEILKIKNRCTGNSMKLNFN